MRGVGEVHVPEAVGALDRGDRFDQARERGPVLGGVGVRGGQRLQGLDVAAAIVKQIRRFIDMCADICASHPVGGQLGSAEPQFRSVNRVSI
ncbi:hypothetical protein GCM10010431_12640 [Streptomyces kunmingensis]